MPRAPGGLCEGAVTRWRSMIVEHVRQEGVRLGKEGQMPVWRGHLAATRPWLGAGMRLDCRRRDRACSPLGEDVACLGLEERESERIRALVQPTLGDSRGIANRPLPEYTTTGLMISASGTCILSSHIAHIHHSFRQRLFSQ